MSVAVTQLVEWENLFAAHVAKTDALWLRDVQTKHMQEFLLRGFPTKREEMWKYTNVSRADFSSIVTPCLSRGPVNKKAFNITGPRDKHGVTMEGSHRTNADGIIFCSIIEALKNHEELIKPYLSREANAKRYPFAALSAALMTDGYFLYIPKNAVLTTPIHQLFSQQTGTSHSRNIIVAGESSQAVLVEEYSSTDSQEYFTNTFTQIHLEENAKLHCYKIQDEGKQATHISNVIVEQKRNSVFNHFKLDVGGTLVREDVHVLLRETGAECFLNGLYYLQEDKQHIDNHLYVDHLAPQGNSQMHYKGILQNKSRAVFNGKVFVEKDAQKTNSNQSNHNLLLSKDAEIDAKPELEIYADDVKCAHGATVGQLDAEALFFLRSRGIEKQEAEILLTHAFAEDVFRKIEHADMLQYIQERVAQHEKC
jgi:Fe-S cluster assembly protein SufD